MQALSSNLLMPNKEREKALKKLEGFMDSYE